MKRSEIKEKGLLRISEVAKATGVSLPTIHFYVREGLLSPSVKTARNMAYYDPKCVEDIRLIKELQAKRFLPLSAIKLVIQAKQEGQNINHVNEMDSLMNYIFRPVGKEAEIAELSFFDLAAATNLSVSELKDLEAMGLLIPTGTGEGKCYDDIDVCVGKIVKELFEFGVGTIEMSIYSTYIKVMRDEVMAIHEIIHKLHDTEEIPMMKLINKLDNLKKCLAMKIYRQLFLEHQQ